MKKVFRYIPRITIVPGVYEEERIEVLAKYCLEYRYDEVMFFLNAEDLNDGHIELDALDPYLDVIERAKCALAERGIMTSLNPWNTLLGGERGRTLKPGQNFETMVDIDGKKGAVTPCPLSESWREYFLRYYLTLIERIRPNIIWIEDDFRMHNHAPLHWGGCFCEKHMRLYSAYAGRTITREELVKGMADGGSGNIFREAYYFVTRKVMRELAEYIGKGIHALYPQQKIGLMTSDPKMHSIEGRDWYGILYALGGAHTPIDRIHLPCYRQCCTQDYCWDYNDVSMQTRALIPEETCVLPEIESAMFSPYTKSRNFTRFQAESCLSLCPNGVTLDLDCFAGNGLVPEYGYGEKLARIKDYLSEFVDLHLPFSSMRGIVIPVREDAYLYAAAKEYLSDVRINENWWASHLASLGITYRYSKQKRFENEIVAVSGNYFAGLSDAEIADLFANNFLLLEGKSVEILFRRGLNRLVGAKSYRILDSERGEYSFEEAAMGKEYLGMKRARASAAVTCPPFLEIEYDLAPAEIYSYMCDHHENVVGPCEVRTNRAFVLPFLCTNKHFGLLTTMRSQILKEALKKAESKTAVVFHDMPYVSTYFYETEKFDVLLLVNFSDDDHENVRLDGMKRYRAAWLLDRKNARWRQVRVSAENGKSRFDFGIESLSTRIVKLEK